MGPQTGRPTAHARDASMRLISCREDCRATVLPLLRDRGGMTRACCVGGRSETNRSGWEMPKISARLHSSRGARSRQLAERLVASAKRARQARKRQVGRGSSCPASVRKKVRKLHRAQARGRVGLPERAYCHRLRSLPSSVDFVNLDPAGAERVAEAIHGCIKISFLRGCKMSPSKRLARPRQV